jgi:hypothetical protein
MAQSEMPRQRGFNEISDQEFLIDGSSSGGSSPKQEESFEGGGDRVYEDRTRLLSFALVRVFFGQSRYVAISPLHVDDAREKQKCFLRVGKGLSCNGALVQNGDVHCAFP